MRSDYRILLTPDPRLRAVSKALDTSPDVLGSPEFQQLVRDLSTVAKRVEALGMAAPQIGVPLRVIILTMPDNHGVMVNPSYEATPGAVQETEGEMCYSCPYVKVPVERPDRVLVKWTNRLGEAEKMVFQGLPGRAVQHEIDHLDGITLWDHMDEDARAIYTKKVARLRKTNARKRRAKGLE